MQTEDLLQQSQKLAGELQSQQGELQQTNEQLEQKAQQLAERNTEVERKNQEIEQARRAVEEKATELALTSRYKSEFLANMSHELRTPLNSILILGQQLADNPDGNLKAKQVEFARTIHGAGTDLLNLISDILDLSKIESGTVTVDAEEIFFTNVLETVARPFRHQAELQGLSFDVQIDPNLGRSVVTDSKRLQQILKNLLSQRAEVHRPGQRAAARAAGARRLASRQHGAQPGELGGGLRGHRYRCRYPGREAEDRVRGLPAGRRLDQPQVRRHGPRPRHQPRAGAAAGRRAQPCAARRAWARPSRSSCRPCTPARAPRCARPRRAAGRCRRSTLPERLVDQFPDDRHNLQPGEPIAADRRGRSQLCRHPGRCRARRRPQGLVTSRGAEALDLALEYQPVAMSLDIFLPDMLGWNVLSQFKRTLETRHIPVQILSMDEDRQQGLARGAFSYLNKPTTTEGLSAALSRISDYVKPRKKRLLIAEDNEAERMSVSELLAHPDLEIDTAATGREALDKLRESRFDCMVLDLRLPDMSGFEVLEEMQTGRGPGRPAGGGLHRPRADARGGRAAAHHGALDRGQGCGLARAAVRRDRPLPAPGRLRPAAGEAAHPRAPACLRRDAGRPHRAGGRRRHAQHLRAVERARAAQHARADARPPARRRSRSSRSRPRWRSC